ncbi:Lrp/AsnC family transcriptional regulator [Neisseria wadsworthii]|uniref:Lrp/AsnC family transcriptional regulator n=1 Tax=Neisseria wadsworthii TaxID=607711 RepID=UPI001F26066B|nr:Lrp/AsnC family transcriptional regulator [Neisseria wadsworthii]
MYNPDKLDRQILNILQSDATLSLNELSAQVNASVATCQRRILNMKQQGIILKQVVLVNPAAVGRSLSVFVSVEMASQNTAQQDAFVRRINEEPDVAGCYEVSGAYDYMLLVHAKNMEEYHQFTRRALNSENNVRSFTSQFVMNFNKVETKITLE